jgi:hypothetical protein
MNKNQKIGLMLIGVIVIVASMTFVAYSIIVIQDVFYLEMSIKSGDNFGFNVENDKLYFGIMPIGANTYSEREVLYHNPYDFPVKLSAKFYGEMKDWVIFEDNGKIFEAGETDYVYFYGSVGEGAKNYYNYTGQTKIYVKRVFS